MDRPTFRVLELSMAPPHSLGAGSPPRGEARRAADAPRGAPAAAAGGPLAEKPLAALPRPCGGGWAPAGARGGGGQTERETEARPSRRAWLPKRVRDVFPVRGKHQIEVNKQREI